MKVCAKCKKEMTCIKTGCSVRYTSTGTHAYRGDKYKCSICGTEVIFCNERPCEDDNFIDEDVFMDVKDATEARRNQLSVSVSVCPDTLVMGAIKR